MRNNDETNFLKRFKERQKEGNFKPAVDYFEKTGINVYREWVMPNGYDSDSMYIKMVELIMLIRYNSFEWATDKYEKEPKGLINKLFFELIDLNPELEVFREIDQDYRYDVLCGASSMFNFDDINFYVSEWIPTGLPTSGGRKYYDDRWERIRLLTGVYAQWVMSENTMNEVEKQIIMAL